MVDDYYLNLVSFSSKNVVAVALSETTYMWTASTGEVHELGSCPEGTYASSVDWSADGAFVGIGLGTGAVELWDAEANKRLRTMSGHQGQVAVLSWNGHVLSSGCGDGSIWHHDVRIARHKVMELLGHTGEVCGLKWRPDGEMIASGGNDNVVNIWDSRLGGDVSVQRLADAKYTKRNHTAAVKAIAWAPWDHHVLASGGGTSDANIHVWSVTTGARLQTVKTPAQVTSLIWSPHKKEILSTHGYPTNSLMVHAYPSMSPVAEIRDAHDSRVLYSAIAPAGDVVVTGAGDENLKFWRSECKVLLSLITANALQFGTFHPRRRKSTVVLRLPPIVSWPCADRLYSCSTPLVPLCDIPVKSTIPSRCDAPFHSSSRVTSSSSSVFIGSSAATQCSSLACAVTQPQTDLRGDARFQTALNTSSSYRSPVWCISLLSSSPRYRH